MNNGWDILKVGMCSIDGAINDEATTIAFNARAAPEPH
jgi:hypothetical protein